MRLVVLVGNPRPKSRTLVVADLLGAKVAAFTEASHDLTIDLCELANDLFHWPNAALENASMQAASADFLIVASPTYKASYTGMLKAFLDRYPSGGLSGTTAIPLMTAGDPAHGLAVDFTLRPLLVELGASVPTRGMFFLTSQIDEAGSVLDAWVQANAHMLGHFPRNTRTAE